MKKTGKHIIALFFALVMLFAVITPSSIAAASNENDTEVNANELYVTAGGSIPEDF